MTRIPLSVLDIQWPGHVPDLVPAIEMMGYHRYWASEHYSPTQSASPLIVAALAAGLSENLRVGTAGVLLRLTSVARVLHDRATLELFYPGRFDLGIAGAVPGDAHLARHATDGVVADPTAYAARVRRLVDGLRSHTDVGPTSEVSGQTWLCGTSVRAAELAGNLGVRFAFHHYLAGAGPAGAVEVADAYRRAFVPAPDLAEPWFAIAVYGTCAGTEREALDEWKAHFAGRDAPVPSFAGTPAQCADILDALATRYGAREIALDCFTSSVDARLEGLGSLAAAW